MIRLLPLIILTALANIHGAAAQIVINEIMYAPSGDEPEWVELHNPGPVAVDLSGWSIHDEGGGIVALPTATIAPGGFLVLTRDTARLAEARWVRSPMIQMALPLLNNTGDALALGNDAGRRIDSLRFNASWGGTDGISIERRRPTDPGSRASSWGVSEDPDGATPGRANSISPVGLDLALVAARFDRASGRASAVVMNAGAATSSPAVVVLSADADGDGTGAPEEELARAGIGALIPGDSATVVLGWSRPLSEPGESGVIEVRMDGDERPGNDMIEFVAQAPLLDTGVVINEIMFDPLPVEGAPGAEYIELYNRNGIAIRIGGWRILDATRKPQGTIPADAPPIPPKGYCAIASDSAIFRRFPSLAGSAAVIVLGVTSLGLNADGDDVVLRNNSGVTVDSLHYLDDWHRREIGETKGLALERISESGASTDRRNWSTSAGQGGGTPGSRNSVAIPPSEADARLAIEPATVSPDGDGFEDFTRIAYHLPARTARIVADVHDRWGRRVRRIASNEPASAAGELIWDGRDDDGIPLEPGIYLVTIEAYDDGGGGSSTARGTVVVAKKL
jgi:hypothetical protein